MSRRALLAALAGASAIGGASAYARSRDEDPRAFNRRTAGERIDYGESEGFRQQMQSVAQGLNAQAVLDENAPDAVKRLAGSQTLRRLQRGETASMADYRAVIDAYATINPQAAKAIRAEFSRFEPKRDRDIDESGLGAVGAGIGGLAALALARGRTASVRRALVKQIRGAGAGALGAGSAAAFANADQAVLSGDDAPDIGVAAAGGAAVGAGLVAGRSGLLRLVRAAAVRRQRLAQVAPELSGPILDARDGAKAATRAARARVPVLQRDSDMLAEDVLHMERTLEAAGMERVLTSAGDAKAVARQLRRHADAGDMQAVLDTLEGRYREALRKLKVSQKDAPSLRHVDPYVTDPAERAGVEQGVKAAVRRRQRRRKAQKARRARERNGT